MKSILCVPVLYQGRLSIAPLAQNPSLKGLRLSGYVDYGALDDKGASRLTTLGHLSFDQWKQNQVVALQYSDDGRSRYAGLNVWDRPTDAPTWVVIWDHPEEWGLDESGQLQRALHAHYRLVARVCRHPVWLRSDVSRTLAPLPTNCGGGAL